MRNGLVLAVVLLFGLCVPGLAVTVTTSNHPGGEGVEVVLAPEASGVEHGSGALLVSTTNGGELECPCGALMEDEPDCYNGYIDECNGGCNSSPAVFRELGPGCEFVLCGKSGVYDHFLSRDTDWFEVELFGESDIEFCCTAEFPLQILLIDGNSGCESTPIIGLDLEDPYQEACIDTTLQAGTYWLWVGPSEWSCIPCGSDYVMTVGIEPDELWDITPESLDFDSIGVGAVVDLDFTITNTGCLPLCGTVSEACIPYSIVEGAGDYELEPGESWPVTVRFAPMDTGYFACDIGTGTERPLVASAGTAVPVYCGFRCWDWTGACLRGPNQDVCAAPACVRDYDFASIFPSGLVVGATGVGLHKVTWTTGAAIKAFNCGCTVPAVLDRDYVNPGCAQLGSIYGEVAALRLNREASCGGYFSHRVKCYGTEVVPPEVPRFAGLTVDQLLAVADQALAGNPAALVPYGNSLLRLQYAVNYMNSLHFGECRVARTLPRLQGLGDGEPEETRQPLPEGILVTSRPNPTESGVTIGLALPVAANVILDVYDVQGRRVAAVASGPMAEGQSEVTWNGADDSGAPVSSGVYFLRVQVNGQVAAMHKLTKL